MHTVERTLAIIKPDAMQKKVMGKIIAMIEENNFTIIAIKQLHLSVATAQKFYEVHKGKSFYDKLIEFMCNGPCVVMVIEGDSAIDRWRTLMGPTDPSNAPEGSIRRQFGTTVRHNAVHGSDSPESALSEIAFFFSEIDLPSPSPFSKESSN
jgi:nucleoside-diphosphate kinase